MKYLIGDVFNNRILIGKDGMKYVVECLDCGKITRQSSQNMIGKHCRCVEENTVTFTTKPLNKKLSAIRDKYKNGVTMDILNEWIGG